MDLTFIISAVIFTLFAIVVATALFRKSSNVATRETKKPGGGLGLDRPVHNLHEQTVEDCTALSTARSSQDHLSADGPPESLGILDDTEFKYMPGAVRTQQMQSMMSKDELEDERRVQREQLAAIFQLLKDNQETFGEVAEEDMDQQLKLYSI